MDYLIPSTPFQFVCVGIIAGYLFAFAQLLWCDWQEARKEKPSVTLFLDDPSDATLYREFMQFDEWCKEREKTARVNPNV